MIQKLTDLVIKPYRPAYDPKVDLGPATFSIDGEYLGARIDFKITNRRNQTLECSLFRRIVETNKKYPLIVFCHGNTGNRTASYGAVYSMLRAKVNVVTFDFAGCGLSEGSTVSLGYYEQNDIADVIDYVIQKYSFVDINRIGLWGRCMGAASSLLCASRSAYISLLILDTPFADLSAMLREYIQRVKIIPKWAEDYIYDNLRGKIKEQANFDFQEVAPVKKVSKLNMPAIFVHGTKDGVVTPQQFKKVYDAYAGRKEYIELETTHNDQRPDFVYQKIAKFVQVEFFDKFHLQTEDPTPKHMMNPSLNTDTFTPRNLQNFGQVKFNESVCDIEESEFLEPIQLAFQHTLTNGEFNEFWNANNKAYDKINLTPQNKDIKEKPEFKMISTQATNAEISNISHYSQLEDDDEADISEEQQNFVKMRKTKTLVHNLQSKQL